MVIVCESHTIVEDIYVALPLRISNGISNVIREASLVAQWLRIRLPMQGTQVRALVREDPTCHRATKPVRHSY